MKYTTYTIKLRGTNWPFGNATVLAHHGSRLSHQQIEILIVFTSESLIYHIWWRGRVEMQFPNWPVSDSGEGGV